MTKIYEEEIIKREKVVKTICDKCKKEIKPIAFDAYASDWFKFSVGESYPEFFNYISYEMDLCLDCTTELLGHLRRLGYGVSWREIED